MLDVGEERKFLKGEENMEESAYKSSPPEGVLLKKLKQTDANMSNRENENEMKSESKSGQIYKVVIIVLVVVAVIQCMVLVTVTIYWSNVRARLLSRRVEPDLSVTTSSLFSRHGDVIPKEFENFRLHNNDTEYIGSAGDILTSLSHWAVSNHYNDDATPETVDVGYNRPDECREDEDQPWIKLTNLDKLQEDSIINSSKVFWNDENSNNETDLTYSTTDGAVVVNKTGHYFVTTQIMAECAEEQSDGIDKPLRIHIFVRSHEFGSSRCILQNARSKCDRVGNDSFVTSSVGAVFKLLQHDRLFLAISNRNRTDSENNYFAVHAL